MLYKIEHIETETWHRIMQDLLDLGFIETYQYTGMDAGIDYQRYDLLNHADGEQIVFEWTIGWKVRSKPRGIGSMCCASNISFPPLLSINTRRFSRNR